MYKPGPFLSVSKFVLKAHIVDNYGLAVELIDSKYYQKYMHHIYNVHVLLYKYLPIYNMHFSICIENAKKKNEISTNKYCTFLNYLNTSLTKVLKSSYEASGLAIIF